MTASRSTSNPSDYDADSDYFWLPDLTGDWEARYRPALSHMRAARYELLVLEMYYRRWQQRFEAGLMPKTDGPHSPTTPPATEDAAHDNSTTIAPIEVDGAAFPGYRWSQVQESNLGMVGLSKWVDADALYRDQADQSGHETTPLAVLLATLETDPALVLSREKASFGFAHADALLSQLIQEQPQDVLAWSYRGETRKSWAALIKLGLLPLSEQPISYPRASQYRKLVDSAVADLSQAIELWVQRFPDPEEPEPEDGAYRPTRPRGNAVERSVILQHLLTCYLLRYELYKAERKRGEAIADLSGALSLKPRISLFLARAELFQRLGQFRLAAKDYLESLVQVTEQIPISQRPQFEQNLKLLRIEMSTGNTGAVIRHACRFWQVNPMLMLG